MDTVKSAITHMAVKLVQYMEEIDEITVAVKMLLDYKKYHGSDGIIAMANFVDWQEANKPDGADRFWAIRETLIHDLNGRADRFFEPRTMAYLDAHVGARVTAIETGICLN